MARDPRPARRRATVKHPSAAAAGEIVVISRRGSDAVSGFRDELARQGVPDDIVPRVIAALSQLTADHFESTPTAAEREFARAAGLPESMFTAEATAADRAHQLRSAALDATELEGSLLSTAEVADRLHATPDNIRQQVSRGSLYSAGQVRGQKGFPRWQFTSTGVIPGLREVITAIPADYHPLDVEAVMTEPDESLGDRSPKEWLATGGAVDPVLRLVNGLSYT